MLRSISWAEFIDWIAYSELEPFDEVRADIRAASICATLANIHRNSKKRPQPFKISDFLVHFEDDDKPKSRKQSWQQQKLIATMIATAMNAEEDKRQKRKSR